MEDGMLLDLPRVPRHAEQVRVNRGAVRQVNVGKNANNADKVTVTGLHASQKLVAESEARFRVLACGRRWGKTRLASSLAFIVALQGGRSWWVAPTYALSRVGWRIFKNMARLLGDRVRVSEVERRIEVIGSGGWLQVRSAHDPDSLVSEGLDFVVMDECALMGEEAWEVSLRPALADRGGKAVFISTPRGRNWFWRLYVRGESGEEGWASWCFPTWDNPFIRSEEIESARRDMPEMVFRQEFGAEFIEGEGSVFRNVMGCVDDEYVNEVRGLGGPYVFGVDWGRTRDYTAVVVVDSLRGVVLEVARWGGMAYEEQVKRLWELYERYRPELVVAEANSMGGPMVERLRREGMVVVPVWMDRGTKGGMVERLRMAFERGEIVLPDDRVLCGELMAYEEEALSSGGYRYGAPSGVHDDCVVALMLAWSRSGLDGSVTSVGGGNPYWSGTRRGASVDLVDEGGHLVFRRGGGDTGYRDGSELLHFV